MAALVRAVEQGSLSAAARSLGTTQPTVSKLLTALERQVGARLLERSSQRVSPTDEGRRLLETARRMLEDYDEVLADVRSVASTPRGRVRLAAPVALGECRLNAWMPSFLAQYPDVLLDVILEDRFVDLVGERIDLALRIGGTLPNDLVARPVGTWPRLLVASPGYLQRHGTPQHPADLAAHAYLRYAAAPDDTLALTSTEGTLTVPVRSRYRINSAVALRHSVEQGAGITLQPRWMVSDLLQDGRLVQVLPAWNGAAQVAHLIHAPRRRLPARVAVLLDYLLLRLASL